MTIKLKGITSTVFSSIVFASAAFTGRVENHIRLKWKQFVQLLIEADA